jgi:anti-sigma factor RsiW
MRCPIESQENLELLLDYGSGKAGGPLAGAFREHLETCAACREAVAGQRQMRAALDLFDAPEVSLSFNRQLYRRIEEPTRWSERLREVFSRPLRELLFWKGVPVAAAAAVVLVAGMLLQRPQPSRPGASIMLEVSQPEQVLHALDDMEMLDTFDQAVPAPGRPQL